MTSEPHIGDGITLLDGATGTELDRRGVDVSLPLWSARALIDAPEVVERVHLEYLEAGATMVTANTFRTHRRTLARCGLGDQARSLTDRAVTIAHRACREHGAGALVAGSVSPLEDCYRPDLAPDARTCAVEHAEIIGHLVDAGCDVILIETMNNAREALAAAAEAERLAPGRWMISFCTTGDGPGRLPSGDAIDDLIPRLAGAAAVGVNCVGAPVVESEVRHLRTVLPGHIRIAAWANIGYADGDGNWISTDAVDPIRYADYAAGWVAAGATIVGGCCGTTPETIRQVVRKLANAGAV